MTEESFQCIPLNVLTPFPLSIRIKIVEETLLELAETIKANGVVEPLVVRPSKTEAGKYEIVCGYRRFKAAELAGLETVPCIVKDMADDEAMEAVYIENEQREDISDYERGRWFKLLMEKFPNKYPDLNSVAESFGYKTKSRISQMISHCEFIDKIKQVMPPNMFTRVNGLPEGITREIRRAPFDAQPKLVMVYLKSVDEGTPLTVRDLAKMVDKLLLQAEKADSPAEIGKSNSPVKADKLEAVIEHERKRIVAEKENAKAARKLDQEGRIYLMLSNYYPDELVEFLYKHVDLGSYTEQQAISLTKSFLEVVLLDFTNGWKNPEKLEPYIKAQVW